MAMQLPYLRHLRQRSAGSHAQAGQSSSLPSSPFAAEVPSSQAWASQEHVNGVTVFEEAEGPHGEGGAFMVSCCMRASPRRALRVHPLHIPGLAVQAIQQQRLIPVGLRLAAPSAGFCRTGLSL